MSATSGGARTSGAPRRASPVRSHSPPPSHKPREAGTVAASGIRSNSRVPAPDPVPSQSFSPRPLLDELFGFGGDTNPYDEKFLERPPTTIFAATHFSNLKNRRSSSSSSTSTEGGAAGKEHKQSPSKRGGRGIVHPPGTTPPRPSVSSRRRSRSEMGQYVSSAPSRGGGSQRTITTIPNTSSESSAEPQQQHRVHHQHQQHSFRRGGPGVPHGNQYRRRSASSKSRKRNHRQQQTTSLHGRTRSFDTAASNKSTDDAVRGCVRGGFSLTRQFASCLVLTADAYQEECKPLRPPSVIRCVPSNASSTYTNTPSKKGDEKNGRGHDGRSHVRSLSSRGGNAAQSPPTPNSLEGDDDDDDDIENDTDGVETAFSGTKSGGPSILTVPSGGPSILTAPEAFSSTYYDEDLTHKPPSPSSSSASRPVLPQPMPHRPQETLPQPPSGAESLKIDARNSAAGRTTSPSHPNTAPATSPSTVTVPSRSSTALPDVPGGIEDHPVDPDVRPTTADNETPKGAETAAPHPEAVVLQTPPRPASPTHVIEQGIEATAKDAAGVEWSTPSLHEVRMSLFHQDRQPVEVAARRDEPRDAGDALLPNDFARRMEAELEAVRSQLVQLQQRETRLASASEQRHHAATLSTEKLMLERLHLEEKLRVEVKRNAELHERVSVVEGENADLKNALTSEKLKNAKLVVAKRSSIAASTGPAALSPSSTVDAGETALASPAGFVVGVSVADGSAVGTEVPTTAHVSTVLVALRADLVQARAELAEAHAARLSAEHAQGDLVDKLKTKEAATTALKSLISDLERQKEELLCRTDKAIEDHKAETAQLEAQLQEAHSSLKKSNRQVQSLSDSQRQLQQVVSASESEVARLREEAGELRSELEKTREQHDKRLQHNEDLVQQLRDEVRSLNEKLVHSSAMVVSQAAEHVKERRRFEAELAAARAGSATASSWSAHRSRGTQAAAGAPTDGSQARNCGPDPSSSATDEDDRSSAAASATTTASTSLSGLRRLLMNRNSATASQELVAELLQRSRSFQSQS